MVVLLVVFIVQLSLHLLNLAGTTVISNLLWKVFMLLPTPYARDEKEIRDLRKNVVKLHREMNVVSAQDDFAKWARLRREHDKAKDKHDKKDASTRSFRSNFDRVVGALRFLFVQGFNFLLNSYYSKTAMFWLPQGWVPHPVEWILSCPRAPLGSISVNVWGLACGSVIAMISEAVRAAMKLKEKNGKSEVMSEKTTTTTEQKQKEALKIQAKTTNTTSEKKEL